MPRPTLNILNHDAMGKLVRKWAKGEVPLPATMQEFDAQARAESVNYTVEDGKFDAVSFSVLPPGNVLHFVLPHRSMIEEIDADEAVPDGVDTYPLPDFYNAAFIDRRRAEMSKHERDIFRNARIGEYTTLKCH